MREVIDFQPGKKILAVTTVSFDVFVLETLLPLTCGLNVVIAGEAEQNNPRLLSHFIFNNGIEMIQLTPTRAQLLVKDEKNVFCLRTLSEIMIGGESFSQMLLNKLKQLTQAKIYNMYGATEATIWATVSDVTQQKMIDIGIPIMNTQVYVLDEELNAVSDNEIGELCIAGKGLARGYNNLPELTEGKFAINPFAAGERMYRTGDLARRLPNGKLECIGRNDHQFKLNGFQIELEEIEYHMLNHEAIKQVVVVGKESKGSHKYLCAYYISESQLNSAEIHDYLIDKLPLAMIPSYFICLDQIPETLYGKVDRKRLPEPETAITQPDEDLQLDNDSIEYKVITILNQNIEIPVNISRIDIHEELKEYGVNSIVFIKFIVDLEAEFGFEFDDMNLSIEMHPTLNSIISYIKSCTFMIHL